MTCCCGGEGRLMNSSKVSPASCCFDEVMGCLVDYVKVEVEKVRR